MNLETPQDIADLINLDVEKSTDEFNDLIKEALTGISEKLTEDHCCQILEIRNEFSDLITYCLFFFVKNPDQYDSDYFKLEFNKIINRFYAIVIDYYIDYDIGISNNLNDVINDLNNARTIFFKSNFDGFADSLKKYIEFSLNYFTTKQNNQANQLIIARYAQDNEKVLPTLNVKETKTDVPKINFTDFDSIFINDIYKTEFYNHLRDYRLRGKSIVDVKNDYRIKGPNTSELIRLIKGFKKQKHFKYIPGTKLLPLINDRFLTNVTPHTYRKALPPIIL